MGHILEEMGIKKTRQRVAIIAAMEQADKPCSAEEIHSMCGSMSLSTVYRNLERLLDLGAVEMLSGVQKQRFYQLVSEEHRHYAVCLGCRKKILIGDCPVGRMDIQNFTVTGHKVEIYGYCAKCRGRS